MAPDSRATILVVDHDENVRTFICATLAAANFKVLEARGGLEAISTMLQYEEEIALAVVEIKMPGINGLDLANQIGIERPTTEVLYVSDLPQSIAVKSITLKKPEAVLSKPFTRRQLLDRVCHFVECKAAQCASFRFECRFPERQPVILKRRPMLCVAGGGVRFPVGEVSRVVVR